MVTYEKIDEETYTVSLGGVKIGTVERTPSILQGDPPYWWELKWDAPYGTRTVYARSYEALCRDIDTVLHDLLLDALMGRING